MSQTVKLNLPEKAYDLVNIDNEPSCEVCRIIIKYTVPTCSPLTPLKSSEQSTELHC